VRATLFVTNEHVTELWVIAEDVVERQDHATGVAEEDVDTLAEECLAQHVGADPGALELTPLVEHVLASLLDRGGSR
jgi:hypothetical protein